MPTRHALFDHAPPAGPESVRLRPAPGVARARGLRYLALRDTVVIHRAVVHRDITLMIGRAVLAAAARTASASLSTDPSAGCPTPASPDDATGRVTFDVDDGGELTTAFVRCVTERPRATPSGIVGYELVRPRGDTPADS